MSRRLFILSSFLCGLLYASVITAESLPLPTTLPPASPSTPVQTLMVPQPPATQAASYILIDANSGKVLAEKNADERRPPASLTKIMTMYVVSQALKENRITLTDPVLISARAWKSEGSRTFIKVGDSIPVEVLLRGIIVQSGNDACVAMAEHVAGSEESFSDLMNFIAKQLKMNNSNFTDSTGMPHPNHYTTARDIAKLTQALIANFPDHYSWYKEKWFTYNNIRQPNRNRLLWRDPTVDGVKTGHTEEAGFCLVASAKRGDMRLISVVMGEPSDHQRAEDSQSLLNYGFRFYETHQVYQAAKPLENLRVWYGTLKSMPIGLAQDLFVTVPTGQYNQLSISLSTPSDLAAPIRKGAPVGQVDVKLNQQVILSQPLIALAESSKAGFLTRCKDSIHRQLTHWWHTSHQVVTQAINQVQVNLPTTS